MITTLLNEDGTSLNPPINPLEEKWNKLYPPCSDVYKYKCMYCSDCYRGKYWKYPEEDKEIYEQHLKECRQYLQQHNPSLYRGNDI